MVANKLTRVNIEGTMETTIWSDKKTKHKLRLIADLKERSMAGQIRYMVEREYEELVEKGELKDVPREEDISGR